MTKLNDKYYDAIVITEDRDQNHGGAVRIKIFGVTDELEDKHQPFAIPTVDSTQAVPTKGTYLRVCFDEGDVNKPKYLNASAEHTYLPESFVSGYPNIAVSNLGSDFFIMTHDRASRNTRIAHDSDSNVTWDSFGRITHDSDKGYEKAGQGAKQGNGKKIHPVLTEATIDIFTCRPVGFGSISQGSEYLHVTHVSKSTVGAEGTEVTSSTLDSADATGTEESVMKSLLNAQGGVADSVEYMESPSFVEIKNRNVIAIITSVTGHNDFIATSQNLLDKSKNFSVHYLVGRSASNPSTTSSGTTDNKSDGFAQYVDISNETTLGSNVTLPLTKKPANKNTISVLFVASSVAEINKYQNDKLSIIKTHVQQQYPKNTIEVISI